MHATHIYYDTQDRHVRQTKLIVFVELKRLAYTGHNGTMTHVELMICAYMGTQLDDVYIFCDPIITLI